MSRKLSFPGAYRALALFGCAVLLAIATACGKGDGATAPTDNLAGAFSLVSVDGDDPPVTVFDGRARLEDGQVVDLKVVVLDSEINLDGDDGYFMAISLRVTVDGKTATQSISDEGTYELSGSRLEFESDNEGDFSGSWARGRLTLQLDLMGNGDEYELVYSKGT